MHAVGLRFITFTKTFIDIHQRKPYSFATQETQIFAAVFENVSNIRSSFRNGSRRIEKFNPEYEEEIHQNHGENNIVFIFNFDLRGPDIKRVENGVLRAHVSEKLVRR